MLIKIIGNFIFPKFSCRRIIPENQDSNKKNLSTDLYMSIVKMQCAN